jgi:NADH:ubiquinone oxidoreductase subunit C
MKSLHVTLNSIVHKLGLACEFEAHAHSMWCYLKDTKMLLSLCDILKTMNARVCMITAYAKEDDHELVYHFDIDGETLNLKLHLIGNELPSITPYFKSADWTERELSELYGLTLLGHPNPRRLFLDESLKENILAEFVPLSSAMNGSVGKTLWDKVQAAQGESHE